MVRLPTLRECGATAAGVKQERCPNAVRVRPPARASSASWGEPSRLAQRASSYVRHSRYSAWVRRTNRETAMPEIYVHAVKGRSLDQKRALIKDITDAVVKNFSVPVEADRAEIGESTPTAQAKHGAVYSVMRPV